MKEYLEAFKTLIENYEITDPQASTRWELIMSIDEILHHIEKALKRLESIENANPSEALKNVNNILNNFGGEKVQIETMTLSKCNILTIKQALLKAQEQEKVLSIIKKKRDGYHEYTQEEDDLFKRWLE